MKIKTIQFQMNREVSSRWQSLHRDRKFPEITLTTSVKTTLVQYECVWIYYLYAHCFSSYTPSRIIIIIICCLCIFLWKQCKHYWFLKNMHIKKRHCRKYCLLLDCLDSVYNLLLLFSNSSSCCQGSLLI